MSLDADRAGTPSRSHYDWHDVRFIGAVAGRYAMPERKDGPDDGKDEAAICSTAVGYSLCLSGPAA